MKNKSARHKEINTFRFQPFSERVAGIDVDIFHKVEHEYETQTDEEECYLFQCIQKWNVLNLSESYDKFRKDIQPHSIITLPHLLHKKEFVLEVLLRHLKEKDILCLQPLLEFVVAVAKDLRKEFYPYYPKFLNLLLELLNTKDTDQLEWTFQCLAYIFKFLWRSLIKDISSVFITLLPLLSDNKPDYINNFAAESFAFVARKVKDKKAFLQLILKVVCNEQDGTAGCGKLFFEVTKGVNGQFHSCAEGFTLFLFESLVDKDNAFQDILFEILEHFITNVASNIHPAKCQILWTSLNFVITSEITTLSENNKDFKNKNLQLLLSLLGQAVELKNGKLLQDSSSVIELLKRIMQHPFASKELVLTSIKISFVILLSSNIKLGQDEASSFVRHILALETEEIFLYFVEQIFDYGAFEALILPVFLKRAASNFNKDTFCVLSKLILRKAPLCINGSKLVYWKKYVINFEDNSKNIENIFVENLNLERNDIESYLCSIICLPHVNISDMEVLGKILGHNLQSLCNDLRDNSDTKDKDYIRKQLLLLNMTLEAAIHLNIYLVHLHNSLIDVLLPYCNDPYYVVALKTLNLYLTANKEEGVVINIDNLNRLNKILESNFSSPYHEVRLNTSHIYGLFEKLFGEDCTIFSLCYKVELMKPQVDTYRAQLQLLEKLNYDRQQIFAIKDTCFVTIPLRYLCGLLYINFKLLWEPVGHLITSYANGLNVETFWNIYVHQLKQAALQIREPIKMNVNHLDVSSQFLDSVYHEMYELKDKPDFSNYRNLLWKSMNNFPHIAEAKTRDTSELLLDFTANEYMQSNSEMSSTCNIKQFSRDNVLVKDKIIEVLGDNETTIVRSEESNENEEEIKEGLTEEVEKLIKVETVKNFYEDRNKTDEVISEDLVKIDEEQHVKANSIQQTVDSNEDSQTVRKMEYKTSLRSLIEHLKVFTKIKSPKSMYREPELYKLYYDLLSHKNHEVQRVALDCLLTYKFKYLVPYQKNLYGLIDDKTFKNELITFKVDKESNIIQEEHREQLMPIVMRIVFCKMFAKTGLRTGGKSSGQLRRTLVLRFLAGCHKNEMLTFMHMSFKFYSIHFEDDCEVMVENLSQMIDLENFIPPKRLQSALNLINIVLEQFGGLMGNDLLKFVMKVVLVIAASIKGAFDRSKDIHSGYISSLRNVRSSCVKIFEKFFKHFESYPWDAKEINAIFKCVVFPVLDKLPNESVYTATPLLNLLALWGSIPQYFALLIKHDGLNKTKYPLIYIMKLLSNDKCHTAVVNLITEMIEKMLLLKESDDDNKLPVENLITFENTLTDQLNLNYGSYILLPHISYILEKIRNKLKQKVKGINQRELFILSRISELVTNSEMSDTILELLLPIVLKRCNQNVGEEIVLQYTSTISNLLKNVDVPQKHLKTISPLFSEIVYPSSRKLLCEILKDIAEKSGDVEIASNLIKELNAWDAKWIDQPDYQRRLNAFKSIQHLINSNSLDIECGVILFYNCLYLINSEKDISLRESASYCLKILTPLLVNNNKSIQSKLFYLLEETVIPTLRNGLKSKNNEFRNECISLLGVLARECADSHVIFRDLNKLTNKNDLEVDFFENLIHLQLHRHIRALLKFVQVFKQETTLPNTRTLTQFILPLTSYYLCNEKFINKNSMVDAAIETIGVVCKLLPWHHYEGILKFYLTKLRYKVEYQRQLVRLIVTILDSFHYDLHKGFEDRSVQKHPPIEVLEESNEIREEEQEVDEVLEEIQEETGVEEDQEPQIIAQKPYDKITILCKSTACRVIKSINLILLPQLHKSLAVLTQHDTSHKINRKRTAAEREEEDLLKVPISLALVKLLQKLPSAVMETNLPGIFMKLCTFLKSQLESVRRAARETFQKIMLTIGPDYLNVLLEEIVPLMTRGFQVHVLVYTVHSVLTSLKELYKPGHIDKVLLTIIELCKTDLFGTVGEEKEISKIVSKTSEAKSTKSCDTFQIVSQFITEKCLMDLMIPIKNVMVASHSFKTVVKLQDCLRHIALGLIDNQFLDLHSLLKFSYGVSSESIPELLGEGKMKTDKEKEKLLTKQEDCMLIPKEPVYKSGYRLNNVKKSSKTNAYILIEFGLRLCYFLLKRDRLKDLDFISFMDPFVSVFRNCLNSMHVKLSTVALQCLSWVLKYELPSLKDNIKDITKAIFDILHKYAAAGLSKGDNFDLVVAAFKTMTVLVRDVKYHTIEVEQLKMLLLYVEQDLHNYEKQATAFGLLRAIISRKLIVPELNEVMQKVAELSIVSEASHVRLQSRVVFHQYVMDYPLGNKLEDHISFYLKQLNYEVRSGRESALEMIQSFINSFPYTVLRSNSGTFLITLGARLINDDSPECKKMISNCISLMMKKLKKRDMDNLFDMIALWFTDNKIGHKSMAAQLSGIFVQVEKAAFEARLSKLIPLILSQFGLNSEDRKPGQFVLLPKDVDNDDEDDEISKQRANDHHVFLVLQMLLKICANCPSFLKDNDYLETLANYVQTLLAHPHDWVRLASTQFLGYALTSINIDDLALLLRENKESDAKIYLYDDPVTSVKSLTLDLIAQLQPGIKSDFAEQVIKNLVFIARVLQRVPLNNDEANNTKSQINLLWLAKKMRRVVNTEIVETPNSTVLRMEVFKWIAGIGTALDLNCIKGIVNHLLAPLVREMSTIEESNAPLRQLSKQVANILKSRIGMEEYMNKLSKLQQHLSVKRAERKRSRNQLAVTDPEIYAKRKIKRHEKKKEAKKRKIVERKGSVRKTKRRKVVDLEDNSEII